jgi:ubiquinone/menaquinone biosynthesis C-methylase UbiE
MEMNVKKKIGDLDIEWSKLWQDGIMDAWSHQYIKKYGSITAAWDHKAAEYTKSMEHSNRTQLIEKIEEHSPETVLDVGAGTGIFALPLAKSVKRVVAVEPSPGMLDILKNKAEANNLTNIECINKKWEDTTINEVIALNKGKYDLIICSHALYYITDLHDSFRKMNEVSKGFIYLLIGAGHDTDDSSYSKYYNIEMLEAYAKRYVQNMDEAIDLWKEDIDGEPTEDQRDAIRDYLSDKIKKEGESLYWEWRSKDALIYWRAE